MSQPSYDARCAAYVLGIVAVRGDRTRMNRRRPDAEASRRMLAAWLVRHHSGVSRSYPAIARAFGYAWHTSVLEVLKPTVADDWTDETRDLVKAYRHARLHPEQAEPVSIATRTAAFRAVFGGEA